MMDNRLSTAVLLATIVCAVSMKLITVHADTVHPYTNGNDIVDMTSHGDFVWCATTGGVVQWDTRSMTYRKYTTIDGLPTNGILCIDAGDNGEVWCGTLYGAVRFDGVSWKTFTTEDGLFSDYVNDISVGTDGVVWCSTEDGGISRYDQGVWDTLTWPDELPLRWIEELHDAPNGDIWFGMHGIYKYDGTTFESMSGSLEGAQMRTMTIGPQGDVWLIMERHVYHYVDQSWEYYPAENNPSSLQFSSISMGPDGTCWFAQGKTLWKYDNGFVTYAKLPMDNASAITVDARGSVWIGCRMSLYAGKGSFIKADGNGTAMYQTEDDMSNYVRSVSSGPNDGVLLTCSYGLFEYRNETVQRYCLPGYEEWPIDPQCTAFDTFDRLWFGFYNAFAVFDFDSGDFSWTSEPVYHWGSEIDTMAIDHSGNLWFNSWSDVMTTYRGYGVVKWNGSESTNYTYEDGLIGNWIQDIIVDNAGNIWAAGKISSEVALYKAAFSPTGRYGGVSRFDGSSWTSWYPEDGIAHYDVLSLGASSNGVIWAGTREGLSHFDGSAWESLYVEDGLPDNRINTIAVDSDDVVWVGTNNGAASYDGSVWKRYTVADGLPDRIITDICIDRQDNVFFCSKYGFAVLNRSSDSVEREPAKPSEINLLGVNPNPFNLSTTITYTLSRAEKIELSLYSATGQKVAVLVDYIMPAGKHSVTFDGSMLSSGVYFCRLKTKKTVHTEKMTLLK